MSKRKYTHIQVLLPEIQAMIARGKSHREIEEFFGLTGDRPIHNLLKRERRKENAGIASRLKGRPRKDAAPRDLVAEQAYEIDRLKRENKLLRDFLQLTGRK
ncbi:MAG: imidazolonepropionase [bacterium]|nr:imidazolonepropionase [bacterium]MDY4100498.1 imidazolonepropionase [Lachnospiraceae bacterium]